ncbi:MAG: CvpA family protein [Gammaproteobacteria bacterium]|nr:CvpA family protein [Gammaproteobacteria bacterium]
MLGLNTLDLAFIGILLASALIGLVRGLVREAISLLVWVAALWVAGRHSAAVAPLLAEWLANPQARLWAARGAVFLGVLIGGGLLGWLVTRALRSAGLGLPDRLLGVAFGVARGVLLVAVTVIVLRIAAVTGEPWWQESKLIPYAAPVADALREAAEQGLGRSWSLTGSFRSDSPAGLFAVRS